MCADGKVELPAAPMSWAPSVRAVGDPASLAECPHNALDVFDGLQGTPDVSCACSCTAPQPARCAPTLSTYSDTMCGTMATDIMPEHATCTNAVTTIVPGSAQFVVPPPTSTLCDAAAVATPSAVSWDDYARLCLVPVELEAGIACMPVPDGYEAVPCLHTNGDVQCPAGFDNREVRFSDVDDTRSCNSGGCSCDLGDAVCNGSIIMHANQQCDVTGGTTMLPHNMCTPVAMTTDSFLYNAAPTGSCGASGTAMGEGSVTPTRLVTICCAQ